MRACRQLHGNVSCHKCTRPVPILHAFKNACVHALVPFPFLHALLFTCFQNVHALLHVVIPKLTRRLLVYRLVPRVSCKDGRLTIHERLRVITLFSCGHSVSSIRERLAKEYKSISLKGLYNLLKKHHEKQMIVYLPHQRRHRIITDECKYL